MKKQILIVGIMVMLLTFGLCGCIEDQTDDNEKNTDNSQTKNGTETNDDFAKFIGTWIEKAEFEGENITMLHTYNLNGTYNFEMISETRNWIELGTWELENLTLTTHTDSDRSYTYSFTEDYKKLTLTDIGNEEISTLSKQ